jgi:hypothetical protein
MGNRFTLSFYRDTAPGDHQRLTHLHPSEDLAQVRLGFGQYDRYGRFHIASPYLVM